MAFSIKNDEADELLRELVAMTGESLTEAVTESLRERLERHRSTREERHRRIMEVVERLQALPVLDDRHPDEILEWDEWGLPI